MLLFGTLINELTNITSLATYFGLPEKTPNCLSTWNRGVKAYTWRRWMFDLSTGDRNHLLDQK